MAERKLDHRQHLSLVPGVSTSTTPARAAATPPYLALIAGNRDATRKQYRRLLGAPHTFTMQEFEYLIDGIFRNTLTRAQKYDLVVERYLVSHTETTLENRLMVALLGDRNDEFARLRDLLEHRNALKLTVLPNQGSPES